LNKGVIGADAAAAVHDWQTSEQDKIFQSKVQDACARRDFWNTTLLRLEK